MAANRTQLQVALKKPYDRVLFAKEVLSPVFGAAFSLRTRPIPAPVQPNKTDAQIITNVYIYGNVNLEDGGEIICYEIELNSKVRIEHSKVAIQRYARKLLTTGQAALVNFITPNSQDVWRFTLIAKDSEITANGIEEKYTSAKRYTYLLGPSETCKTLADRLEGLSIENSINLSSLIEAFSVEKLNRDFYRDISAQFYHLVGAVTGQGKKTKTYERQLTLPSVSADANRIYHEFAVRLIGRTVFCWFLKVKKSDEGIPLLPENLLSSKAVKQTPNYYHNILEKLFFQTLNTPVENRRPGLPKGSEYIPFLNGGLFEADSEDFYKTDPRTGLSLHFDSLIISDEWFIEFFEKLEQYNFTIDENSTVDIQVSVDPEMLGSIFENLLAEIDPDSGETARKSTGSFYTPREIVDYMVSESLAYYLANCTDIEKEKLDALFKPEVDIEFSSIEKETILLALDKAKILDPACGSGAFPMGILHKIVLALQKLDPTADWWIKQQLSKSKNLKGKNLFEAKLRKNYDYARKIGIIQNNLYGVDIQPIAAEISKLRCFLTLIVNEQIDDESPNRGIEPLPNLEFKFVTADTLMRLPDEMGIIQLSKKNKKNSAELEGDLRQVRQDYLQSFGKEKQDLKLRFEEIRKEMFDQQGLFGSVENNRAFKISNWNPFSHKKTDWFESEWMFGVKEFDIVIGNPPYVQLQKDGGTLAKLYESQKYQTYERSGDIYSLFYESGYNMLGDKRILCFITSNKWMRAIYGKSTRKFFAEKTNPSLLIDFAGQKIFNSATVDTNILLFSKEKNKKKTSVCVVKGKVLNNLSVFVSQHYSLFDFSTSDSWVVLNSTEQTIKSKIERMGTPLKDWDINIYRGILTGYNEAFIINGAKRKELIANDPKSEEIIRPILRGRDIKRYSYEFADLWIITTFPSLKIDIEGYPAIKQHLMSFGFDRLKQTGDAGARKKTNNKWFETQDSISYWEDFYRQKIVWGEISDKTKFAIELNGEYVTEATTFLMTGDSLLYLLGFLNSKVSEYLFAQIGTTTGVGTVRWKKFTIEQLYVPKLSLDRQNDYNKIVNRIITHQRNKESFEQLTDEIDNMIFTDIGLNQEEVDFINSIFKSNT
ncbi:Eco57I restriction-modification methylase domain-containing protein [Pedobacter sp. FW305-3-2-15-E-R2A2]|uniref:Eco57I restriction-modification methylase domain-containing protein n=1 Tax=Pedobacter sp. FW305-3-2-15-E-R2A2 TaxID=3140251 RepID=UPI00314062A8